MSRKTPAIVALFIYVLLPILNNTVLGVKNIDKNVIQAGQSMGMTKFQLMKDVEMPLALPLLVVFVYQVYTSLVGQHSQVM